MRERKEQPGMKARLRIAKSADIKHQMSTNVEKNNQPSYPKITLILVLLINVEYPLSILYIISIGPKISVSPQFRNAKYLKSSLYISSSQMPDLRANGTQTSSTCSSTSSCVGFCIYILDEARICVLHSGCHPWQRARRRC